MPSQVAQQYRATGTTQVLQLQYVCSVTVYIVIVHGYWSVVHTTRISLKAELKAHPSVMPCLSNLRDPLLDPAMKWYLHTTTHTQYSAPCFPPQYPCPFRAVQVRVIKITRVRQSLPKRAQSGSSVVDLYYWTRAEQPFLVKTRSQTLWVHTRWLICIILETQGSFKMGLNYVGVLLLWVSTTLLKTHT